MSQPSDISARPKIGSNQPVRLISYSVRDQAYVEFRRTLIILGVPEQKALNGIP